jgi:tetratricopeptide (TPR) repeat protein
MTTAEVKSTETNGEEKEDRFNRIMAIMIAVVTVIIALVTYLQSDAGNRDDQANRDTKNYSIQAMGRRISGDAQVNYDYNKAYQAYYEMNVLAENADTAGDSAAVERYHQIMDQMVSLSPLLKAPYFNAETGNLNLAKYEADTYLVETTALSERFDAASKVKDAWDSKANTYIIHLTLLAVSLFLFGMATTISGGTTRWIFTLSGVAVTVVAVVWALVIYLQPVTDLRACVTSSGIPAIDAYAQGVGLAHQDLNQDAIKSFDQAVACDSGYSNALKARGDAKSSLGDLAGAAVDYELAQKAGDSSANLAGTLAWNYYLLGRFDDAVAMNQTALQANPGELWIRFDLGLAQLAKGNFAEAKTEYQKGMDDAAAAVAEVKKAGKEASSDLWWAMDDAAASLDSLVADINSGDSKIQKTDETLAAAAEEIQALKSQAVALEYTGAAPQGALAAKVTPFQFAEPVKNDSGEVTDYSAADSFAYGADEVSVQFDYSGMKDGQMVVFKVFIDGEEDPSWRIAEPWDLGADGSAQKDLSFAYSNTKVLRAGEYTVEMYVDNHLAQRGAFTIEAGE